jgi:hypothetical protein
VTCSAPRGDESGDRPAAGGYPRETDADSPSRRRHAVFVSDFVHIERSFDELAAELLDSTKEWHQAAERSAARQRFVLRAGDARQNTSSVIIPMRWEPVAFERLLPVLESDIELLSLGTGHCRLSVSGRYQVPFAQLGATLDRLAMRRVAEMAVRGFLLEIADALEHEVTV